MSSWHSNPVGKPPAFRHLPDSRGYAETLGGMVRRLSLAAVALSAMALAACDGSQAGSCSTARDAAYKVTALTDDLKLAESTGKVDTAKAGEIGSLILGAGVKFGAGKTHHAYCEALDKIRKDSGL